MAGEDPAYLSWVRRRRCAAHGMGDPCGPGTEAHHAGERGLGMRAHDHTAIPLCPHHHHAWHGVLAPFRTMTRAERAGWAERAIASHRQLFTDLAELPAWAPVPF